MTVGLIYAGRGSWERSEPGAGKGRVEVTLYLSTLCDIFPLLSV